LIYEYKFLKAIVQLMVAPISNFCGNENYRRGKERETDLTEAQIDRRMTNKMISRSVEQVA
jgi:hypothetical protein